MKLLVIVLALALDRFSDLHTHLHRDEWFGRWSAAVRRRIVAAPGQLAVVVLGPVLLVLLVDLALQGILLGLPAVLFGAGVLFYSLGRGRVDRRLSEYLADWLRGDHQAAWYTLADWVDHDHREPPATALELHEAVRAAYVARHFYGLFVPVFWYLLLGPAGAMTCMVLHLALRDAQAGEAYRQLADRFRDLVGYVPARVFAGSCAMVGSYGGAARILLEDFADARVPAARTVERAALAALEGEPPRMAPNAREPASISGEAMIEFHALQDLFNRCLVLMLVLVALTVIFGWG